MIIIISILNVDLHGNRRCNVANKIDDNNNEKSFSDIELRDEDIENLEKSLKDSSDWRLKLFKKTSKD